MEQSTFLEEIRTLIRDSPDRGEEQDNLWGESEGSSSTSRQDFSWYDGEAKGDFWSISVDFMHHHHVEPRVTLCVPRKESLSFHWNTLTSPELLIQFFDVMLEKSIDDYWNVDGDRDLSDAWTGFTRFTEMIEKPPDGKTWCGETDEETNDLKTRQIMARNVEAYVWCIKT